jgi:hypothetical protein
VFLATRGLDGRLATDLLDVPDPQGLLDRPHQVTRGALDQSHQGLVAWVDSGFCLDEVDQVLRLEDRSLHLQFSEDGMLVGFSVSSTGRDRRLGELDGSIHGFEILGYRDLFCISTPQI